MDEDKINLTVKYETDKTVILSVCLKIGEIEVEKAKIIAEDEEYENEINKKIYDMVESTLKED